MVCRDGRSSTSSRLDGKPPRKLPAVALKTSPLPCITTRPHAERSTGELQQSTIAAGSHRQRLPTLSRVPQSRQGKRRCCATCKSARPRWQPPTSRHTIPPRCLRQSVTASPWSPQRGTKKLPPASSPALGRCCLRPECFPTTSSNLCTRRSELLRSRHGFARRFRRRRHLFG